jgi:3-oxoacyl-(acyl-carrier-protein) synthase
VQIQIAGVSVRSAAGDLTELLRHLHQQEPAFSETAPYSSEGLSTARCGLIVETDRDALAQRLLITVIAEALDQSRLPDGARIGLVVGTGSGAMAKWERWHAAQLAGEDSDSSGIGRDAPTEAVASKLGLQGPIATLSVACVSGTAALDVAAGWLRDGSAEVVVAAGVDVLTRFVHAGFSGLGALSEGLPAPFSANRDGMLPGEGAAALVLLRTDSAEGDGPWLAGTSVRGESHHLTAPHPEGLGAAAAMRAALQDAGLAPQDVDHLSVHGTATPFSDAMEARAIEAVFGTAPIAIHGVKHLIGHTMGAAGAIEAAVMVGLMRSGKLPPSLKPLASQDPATAIRKHAIGASSQPSCGLSLSAAFGGLYAAALLSNKAPAPLPRVRRPVVLAAQAELLLKSNPDWAALWPAPPARFLRSDRYVRAVLLLLQRLELEEEIPRDAAFILATHTGCRIADMAFHQGLLTRGAARASRRLFTHTLPGAPLAEATLIFGLTGPRLTFLGGMERAEEEAKRWVRQGRAACALAIFCEAPEPDGPVQAQAKCFRAG